MVRPDPIGGGMGTGNGGAAPGGATAAAWVRPGEWVFIGLNLLLLVLAAAGLGRYATFTDLGWCGGVFILYSLVVLSLAALEPGPTAFRLRVVAGIVMACVFYVELSDLAFRWIPWNCDAFFAGKERAFNRSLGLEPFWSMPVPSTLVEVCSYFYLFFLAYLYFFLVVRLAFGDPKEREQLMAGLMLLYGISYSGYLLFPAQGPMALPDLWMPEGGVVHRWVMEVIARGGGPHGAMPSVHAAASTYCCLHELSRGRRQGWIVLPLVGGIYFSTVVLRYHYLMDLAGGFLIAASCLFLGRYLAARWKAPRGRTHSPGVPLGEVSRAPE